MKKFFIILIVILLLGGGVFGFIKIRDHKKQEDIKKGWHVEITSDYINVRKEPDRNSALLGKVEKGDIYKAIDFKEAKGSLYWYKIEFDKVEAWVGTSKTDPWLKDVNNPEDIATPYIKYSDDVYKVHSIDDINYDHLTVIDDRNDYKIEHTIYHEVNKQEFIDQYWINYTVTDAAGKSSSKLQRIEFEVKPKDKDVENFDNYK